MKEFKGTPGPWFWENGVLCNKDFIVGGNGHAFHNQANKNLIAAAPEMLALLEWLIDIEGPQPGHAGWATKVQHVIPKALGESK